MKFAEKFVQINFRIGSYLQSNTGMFSNRLHILLSHLILDDRVTKMCLLLITYVLLS